MVNAEATAETDRPNTPGSRSSAKSHVGPHEDQRRVKILVVLLDKFLVILLGDLAAVIVESGFVVFLNV